MRTPERLLEVLGQDWKECDRCDLATLRPAGGIVFGGGVVPADYLIIGQHPSEDDESTGYAFSEEAWAYLNKVMEVVGIDPDNTFKTHVLGCRPKVILPATETEEEQISERKPDKEEINACRPRLHQIIYQVDPRIIITMGLLPLQVLATTGTRIRKISDAQKQLYVTQIQGQTEKITYPIMAALGIDTILGNPSGAAHGPDAITLNTFQRAAQYVNWVYEQEQSA